MRGILLAVVACIVLAVAYVGYRGYVHAGVLLTPVVVTRQMNASEAVSPGIGARVARLFGGPPAASDPRPKLVALTFDDGPFPVATPLLLDALAELRVPATFFLIGRDAEEFPQLTRRVAAAGIEIGNHTLDHPDDFERLDAARVRAEVVGGAEALHRYSSQPSIAEIMRPPHGRYSETALRALQDAGYAVILWNDDPGDWRNVPPAELLAHVERYATAPDIILMHDGSLATIEMLPQLAARFRAAGYTFVTVSEMLKRTSLAAIEAPVKNPL